MDLTCPVPASNISVTTRPDRRSWLRWMLSPDLAMVATLLTLGFCLVLFDGTVRLFRDSDAGWHIRAGERMLATGSLPRVDSWSLTKSGLPWFAWEWGADVVSGAAHQAGGLAFVAGLYAVLIASATWLWFRLQWLAGGHFLLTAALAILMLSTANIHWHARPHVFSWVLLLLAVVMLESGVRRLALVALLSVVWTNLHASFFLLPVLLAIYAAGHAIRPLIWTGFDEAAEWASARWMLMAALVASAASLVNPYGWQVHQHICHYLGDRELLDRVGEFQSFNFHAEGAAQILLTVAVAGLGGIVALGQKRPAHFLICAMFVAMALRSARVLPIVALVALPLACGAITQALREGPGLQPGIRSGLNAFLQYGDNLRRLDLRFSGVGLIPLILAGTFSMLSLPAVSARASFPPDQFPVKAAQVVATLPASARLLSSDSFGGYLIYRFAGQRKVWFDGRSDFYGAEFMKDYLNVIEARRGALERVSELGFTHALLPVRYALLPALERAGWKRIYSDNVAMLLEAPPRGVKD